MTDANNKSPLTAILDAYRNASATEREKAWATQSTPWSCSSAP